MAATGNRATAAVGPTSEQILAVENGLKQVQPSHQSRYLPSRTGSSRYSLISEQILTVENGLKQVQPHIRADTCRREGAQAGTASHQSRYLPWRTGSSRYSLTSEQILAVENGLKQVQPHIRADTCRRERAQAGTASHQSRYLLLRIAQEGSALISEQILAVENGLKQVYSPHIRADTCHQERAQAGTASHQSRYLP
jgi:hypothetical protein